jgi:hypothetical protein
LSAEANYRPFQHSQDDLAYFARRAAARRVEFLEDHGLHGVAPSGSAIIRMVSKIRAENHVTREAAEALDRIHRRYWPVQADHLAMLKESSGSGFSCHAVAGSDRPVLITQHLDQIDPGEIEELNDFRVGRFDILLLPERWVSRMGFRLLVSDPAKFVLHKPPGPDPEYRPGRSFQPVHVRLRASAYPGADIVHTIHQNIISKNDTI